MINMITTFLPFMQCKKDSTEIKKECRNRVLKTDINKRQENINSVTVSSIQKALTID